MAAAAGFIASALAYSAAQFEMIDQANATVGKDEQFGWTWWPPGKFQELKRMYRQLYPEGKLPSKILKLIALSGAFGIGVIWAFFPLLKQHLGR
jgi:hypothetical protein